MIQGARFLCSIQARQVRTGFAKLVCVANYGLFVVDLNPGRRRGLRLSLASRAISAA
jgi:hypothetical protein